MINKELVLTLLETKTPKEVAEMLKCTPRRISQIRKELEGEKLTLRKYFDAVLSGNYKTKQELAKALRVCRKTLYTFEQENNTKELLTARMMNAGANIIEIQILLGLTDDEAKQLKTIPTISGVKSDLTKILMMLQTLKDSALISREELRQYHDIKHFLSLLRKC
ncbi:MAG: hypothetical protein HDS28_06170 [Bacteroides sp.]|nr:hypothetical protein [Bacteroides sp.]